MSAVFDYMIRLSQAFGLIFIVLLCCWLLCLMAYRQGFIDCSKSVFNFKCPDCGKNFKNIIREKKADVRFWRGVR